jgi:hypothetical protein
MLSNFSSYFQVSLISSELSITTHYSVHAYTKTASELFSLVEHEAQLPIPYLVSFTKPMRDEGMQTFYAKSKAGLDAKHFSWEEPLTEIPR